MLSLVTEMSYNPFWGVVLCRDLNTAGVETLQETVLRRPWLLWMEQSIVSKSNINRCSHNRGRHIPQRHEAFNKMNHYYTSINHNRWNVSKLYSRCHEKDLWSWRLLCSSPAGIALASGLAATVTITHLLKSGDGIVCMDDVYGGETPTLCNLDDCVDKNDATRKRFHRPLDTHHLGGERMVPCSKWLLVWKRKHIVSTFIFSIARHKPLLPKNCDYSWSGGVFCWLYQTREAKGCSEGQH